MRRRLGRAGLILALCASIAAALPTCMAQALKGAGG